MQSETHPTAQAGSRPDITSWLDAGRAALLRGHWLPAADAFSSVVRSDARGRDAAEAWAGLGLASYWRGDAEAAMAAHESAFRHYIELGESAAAARMALWLADEQLVFFAAPAVANGWLEQAERLLAGVAPTAEHLWLLAYRGHCAMVVDGDAARALELAAEGQAKLGSMSGAGEVELVLLALEGLALVLLGRVAEGMPRLDAASAAAVSLDPGDLNAVAWTCCYLVHGCGSVRDFPRAAEWCRRVMAFCERWGLAPVYASCRLDYAAVLTWRGEWAAAESELDRAAISGGGPEGSLVRRARLAELRRRQGRLDEAEALLQEAGGHPLAVTVAAALALDRAQPAVAFDLAERILHQLPAHAPADRVEPLGIRVRAAAALGQVERAANDVAELAEAARLIATAPVRAAAAFSRGVVAVAHGDDPAAVRAFEDAALNNDRGGAPWEAALARIELAAVLARMGRDATARREAALARTTFQALGAARDVARTDALAHMPAAPHPSPLTHREIEVLRLVARGRGNRHIATELFLSPHTVKRHVANILRKLECPTRAAAVARAGQLRLI